MLKKYSITKQAYIPFTHFFFPLAEDAYRNSEHLETENICCRKQHQPIQKHSGSETLKLRLVRELIMCFVE